jgi:hypothetical protein
MVIFAVIHLATSGTKLQGFHLKLLIYFSRKEGRSLDWLEKMNRAIDYIEANLNGSIDYEKDNPSQVLFHV